MVTNITNLYLISLICVLVIDESGVINSLKHLLQKLLNTKADITLKPLDCSLCSTFWVGIIYLLINNLLSISSLTLLLLFAILTPQTHHIIKTLQDKITNLINKLK